MRNTALYKNYSNKLDSFKYNKFYVRNETCDGNRKIFKYIDTNYEADIVYTHQNCSCNEQIAYAYRHMLEYDFIKDGIYFTADMSTIRSVIKDIPVHIPDIKTYDDIINGYTGAMKRKYKRAMYNLVEFGLQRQDFLIKSFIKDDKYHYNYPTIKNKPPRAIQYQSPEMTLVKATYIVDIEHKFYQQLDVHGLRTFVKGLNQMEIGQLVYDGYCALKNPVIIENDYVAFDSHLSVSWLQLYHEYILSHYHGHNKHYLKGLFKYDYKHLGYTTRGNKFKIRGTLASGMIDTSFKGNFVNYIIISTILKDFPKESWKFICNGDDSVLFVESEIYPRINFNFLQFGMEAKTVVRDNIFDVEFCQCHLVKTPLGFIMARDEHRSLSRLGVSFKNFSHKNAMAYLRGLVMCEMSTNYQVPDYYKLLYRLYNMIGKGHILFTDSFTAKKYEINKQQCYDKPFDYDTSTKYDYVRFKLPNQQYEDLKQDVVVGELHSTN